MHVSVSYAITNVLLAIISLKSFTSNIMDKLTIDHTSFITLCVFFSLKQLFSIASKNNNLLEIWPYHTEFLVIMKFILELISVVLMGKPYFSVGHWLNNFVSLLCGGFHF